MQLRDARFGDAEDLKSLRLQKYEDGLVITRSGTAGVLVDDFLQSLLRRCRKPPASRKSGHHEAQKEPAHQDGRSVLFKQKIPGYAHA